MNQIISIILISFFGGLLSTLLFRQLAIKFDIVNRPTGLVPQHTKPIAYLGGVGVLAGIIISCVIIHSFLGYSFPFDFFIFCFAFCILGLIDDLVVLSASRKFAIQVVVAVLAVYFGTHYSFTGIHILDYCLSAFWILILINAFNVTDVCDGLLSGIAITALFIASLAFGDSSYVYLISAGAILGFIVFNFPPASIFLGDAGSHLLGYICAYMTMSLTDSIDVQYSFYILAALCVVPLFEMAFLIVVRTLKGIPWWKGSKDHFALRLQSIGFSKVKTDFVAWIFGLIGGLPLFYVLGNDAISISILLSCYAVIMVFVIIFWNYLSKIEVK